MGHQMPNQYLFCYNSGSNWINRKPILLYTYDTYEPQAIVHRVTCLDVLLIFN